MALAVLLLVLAGGAVTFLLQRDADTAVPEPVTPAEAGPAAAAACAQMQRFEELLAQNASISEVREALRSAERSARRAAQGDATWIALSGGISSVRIAVEANDERVARTGIDVVRTECRRVS